MNDTSLELWEQFAGSVDDAVFEYNLAEHKGVWELAELDSSHLRVQLVGAPTVAVDIEFFPGLLRVVALFSPSGRMRVYDFGSLLDLSSSLGPDAISTSPDSLANSLFELILSVGVE